MLTNIFVIVVLIANAWAIFNTIQSNTTAKRKLLWVVSVMVFPVAGYLLWALAGPKV